MWEWLKDKWDAFSGWIVEVMLWIPQKAYELLIEGLVLVLSMIPVPAWMENVEMTAAGIPAGVAFFLEAMQFGTGIAIVLGALVIRFAIRRIPFFG